MQRRRLTKAERQQVYSKFNGHCAYCGIKIEYKEMQVDHKIPLQRGGSDTLYNMFPACRSCSHHKAALTVEEFREYLKGIPKRLMRNSIPYQVGVRFGIVGWITHKVRFYFENIEEDEG